MALGRAVEKAPALDLEWGPVSERELDLGPELELASVPDQGSAPDLVSVSALEPEPGIASDLLRILRDWGLDFQSDNPDIPLVKRSVRQLQLFLSIPLS